MTHLLSNYVYRDILGYLNRRKLVDCSYLSRRFKCIIESEFKNSPLVILPSIYYDRQCYDRQRGVEGTEEAITNQEEMENFRQELLKFQNPFIRFEGLHIVIDVTGTSFTLDQLLEPISHVWEGKNPVFNII